MWLIPSQFHPCKDKQSRCQQDPWEASLFQLKDSDTCMVPRTDQGRPTPAKAQLSSQTPILPECKHTCSVSPFVRPGGKPVSLILQSSHVGPFLIFQTLLYSSTNTIQAGPEIRVYCPWPMNRQWWHFWQRMLTHEFGSQAIFKRAWFREDTCSSPKIQRCPCICMPFLAREKPRSSTALHNHFINTVKQ